METKLKLLLIGASGGIGRKLLPLLSQYDVKAVSSKDLDIRDYDAVKEFFFKNHFDIVINLAGVNINSAIHKINPIELKSQVDANIIGTVNVVTECLKYMRINNYGRIILISSVLATKNVFGTAVYSASKAFIDRFASSVSYESIYKNITCSSIQLGYADAGMTYTIDNLSLENIGANRLCTIEELHSTIEFLINNAYVSGINLKLDGQLL